MQDHSRPQVKDQNIADGMRIDYDVPIRMDDGNVLRADVYRPVEEGRYPVILSHGPYGKGLSFQQAYSTAWELMIQNFPDVAERSTNKYQAWEVADPEKWVPDGYVCLRIDSRGAGRSPGYMDLMSNREIGDLYDCIEWAAVQPWSNGRVGMCGISYYAQNQWYVAKYNPPSLKAMCVWEGCADLYREGFYTGGMLNEMVANTFDMQMKTVQYGLGERGPRSAVTGELVCGPETLSAEELVRNRFDLRALSREHTLDDWWYKQRSADPTRINIPLLSCGNWGGQPLHTRGNIDGFVRAATDQKWLEMHGYEHWALFYTDYGINLQKRFFDHFLKGEENGWGEQRRVMLNIRHPGEKFVLREEDEWPIGRTEYTRWYLDPDSRTLARDASDSRATLAFDGFGAGLDFVTAPFDAETEITGHPMARLKVSSSTEDADLFLVLRVFDPDGKEVLFRGALDPKTPVAQGWLRASHRKPDKTLSTHYQPRYIHNEVRRLTPGEPVNLDIEIWPTSIVIPAGFKLMLSILGRDFEHDEEPAVLSNMKYPMKGCGPFTHQDPIDRPEEVYGGRTTIHFEPGDQPYLQLPVIPPMS